MQKRYRRFVLSLYRSLRHPKHLRESRVKRWLAQHFVDKAVWRPTRHTLAGGAAVGAFVMVLIIPGQMPLAIALAALFRVNIPAAIVMSWIGNPVTFPFMAWLEIEFGNWLIHLLGLGIPPALEWDQIKEMFRQAPSLWDFAKQIRPWMLSLYVGGVVAGLVFIPVCYAISYVLWDLLLLFTHRRDKKEVL